ncbi:hypothetical protein EV424DRAFT_1377770 [Suillus variegatus]|nr:hypothetical protein EV424DRAFT_1377770 [Suillus variegatus]
MNTEFNRPFPTRRSGCLRQVLPRTLSWSAWSLLSLPGAFAVLHLHPGFFFFSYLAVPPRVHHPIHVPVIGNHSTQKLKLICEEQSTVKERDVIRKPNWCMGKRISLDHN